MYQIVQQNVQEGQTEGPELAVVYNIFPCEEQGQLSIIHLLSWRELANELPCTIHLKRDLFGPLEGLYHFASSLLGLSGLGEPGNPCISEQC